MFRRNKHQKLSEIQKDFLINKIKTSGLLISELSRKYFISLSTLYSLKDTINKKPVIFANKRWNKTTYKEKLKIMDEINNYCWITNRSYTVDDVRMHVENKLKWTYSYNDIYTTMKNHNKLSFKKVQSRPNSIDMGKIKVLRKLFAFRFTEKLK